MIATLLFHIYEKETNKVIQACVTVEEMEQLIATRKIDWMHWEIQPCYTEYSVEDASF